MATINKLEPKDVIESARQFARESRDQMLLDPMAKKMPPGVLGPLLAQRMELVMDSYLTGFEAILNMLYGDGSKPYEWTDDVDHTKLVTELLNKYGLLK